MKNTTPHRYMGFRAKVKAPRGAYTYLRAPVILTDDRATKAPIAPTFTPPALSACRDYGLPVRSSLHPVIEAHSLVTLGIISS